jgi:hypothetical protein
MVTLAESLPSMAPGDHRRTAFTVSRNEPAIAEEHRSTREGSAAVERAAVHFAAPGRAVRSRPPPDPQEAHPWKSGLSSKAWYLDLAGQESSQVGFLDLLNKEWRQAEPIVPSLQGVLKGLPNSGDLRALDYDVFALSGQ